MNINWALINKLCSCSAIRGYKSSELYGYKRRYTAEYITYISMVCEISQICRNRDSHNFNKENHENPFENESWNQTARSKPRSVSVFLGPARWIQFRLIDIWQENLRYLEQKPNLILSLTLRDSDRFWTSLWAFLWYYASYKTRSWSISAPL